MATYLEWNDALAAQAVKGVPSGMGIYLSVDDDLLSRVGSDLLGPRDDPSTYRVDFETALRKRLQERKWRIGLFEFREEPYPEAVGILAAMVLAAHDMVGQSDDGSGAISANNYFRRFREVVGQANDGVGRPPWLLPSGIEEVLWMKWNLWIAERGWVVTAERGEHLNDKYIHYPISQALLRKTDGRKIVTMLRQEERVGHVRRDWDTPMLAGWLFEACQELRIDSLE